MLAGGVLSALLALALGYPCFRLKGHYFSIATIVIAEIGLLLLRIIGSIVGGALGIQWPFNPDSWATLQFARDKVPYFYFALGLLIVTWLVTYRHRGIALGLLVARGEGQSGSRAEPRRDGVRIQDGRRRDLGLLHRHRRRVLRRFRLLYRPGKRDGLPLLAAVRVACGARRHRHAVGAGGRRGGADPRDRDHPLLCRRLAATASTSSSTVR